MLSAGEEGIHIGKYVHIAIYSSLIGQKKILLEDFAGLSSRVSIYSSSDDYSGNSLTNPTVPNEYKNVIHGSVILKRHVIIGAGSIILPNVTIGLGAAIGALSLVNKDCDEFSIYSGVPAQYIKARSRKILELEVKFLNSLKE